MTPPLSELWAGKTERRKKMRFLVTTIANSTPPPEAMVGLLDAMKAGAAKYTESGKFETVWSLAGKPGGGGVVNVSSLEELDAIFTEFPLGPFSDIEIQPIVEFSASIDRAKQAFLAMAQAMPGS